MKTFFSNIAKTKKGKIQLLTMALSTLLAIVFTIILIVFGAKECKYNSPYKFKMNVLGYTVSEEITLKENGTGIAVGVTGSEAYSTTAQYYIIDGNLFIKDEGETEYRLFGKGGNMENNKEKKRKILKFYTFSNAFN